MLNKLKAINSVNLFKYCVKQHWCDPYSVFKTENIVGSAFNGKPRSCITAFAWFVVHNNSVGYLKSNYRTDLICQICQQDLCRLCTEGNGLVIFINRFKNYPIIVYVKMTFCSFASHSSAFCAGIIRLNVTIKDLRQMLTHFIVQLFAACHNYCRLDF